MSANLDKKIATFKYNFLNLPDTVQMRNGNMTTFAYDPMSGEKIFAYRKTYTGSAATMPIGMTMYNNNVNITKSYSQITTSYYDNVIFENSTLKKVLTSDGVLVNTSTSTSSPVFNRNYFLKDHLGNVRVVFDENGIIKQVSNYYPFGMEYGESAQDQTEMAYQDYQFGGKEFDRKFEVNMYDFGARNYDATIGRWSTMDPLAEKYYSISPYVYCLNNPKIYVDPDGKDLVDAHGAEITYTVKNGWSSNVDNSTLRLGDAMLSNPVGRKQLFALMKSDIKTRMILSPKKITSTSGKITEGNSTVDHVKKTATLIVYEGSVNEIVDNSNESRGIIDRGGATGKLTEKQSALLKTTPTTTQREGEVAVHEAEHILNPEAQKSHYKADVAQEKSEAVADKKEMESINQSPSVNDKLPTPPIKPI